MLEWRTAWAMSEEAHLMPIFEFVGRWDGGKAETGVGAGLGDGGESGRATVGQYGGAHTGAETDTPSGLSPDAVDLDMGYGLVTHEGAGLLTTYGGVLPSGPQSYGYRLGGLVELGEWINLSVEGERTTQAAAPHTKSPSTATWGGNSNRCL